MTERGGAKTAAEKIIYLFGGASEVAKVLGINRSSVVRWTYPLEDSGTGGHVPGKYHQALWDAAIEKEYPVTLTDFVSVDV